MLASALVRSGEGAKLGRVRDVYRRDRGGDLAAVSVVLGRFRSRHVLVPATAFTVAMSAESGHSVELHLVEGLEDLDAAIDAPVTLRADPELLSRAAAALGVEPPDARTATAWEQVETVEAQIGAAQVRDAAGEGDSRTPDGSQEAPSA